VQSPKLTRSKDELAHWAQLLLLSRRRRAEMFDAAMFDEAAWDGLLVLYMNERGGIATSAASLAEEVGARLHIMMRWIKYLEAQRLVIREPDQLNGRPGFVRLTDKGHSDLERYLSETLGIA